MTKKFQLKAKFNPAGDQPQAIKKLLQGFQQGKRLMTLLGVTGSGKTYTMAQLISKINKPVLVIAPNKILAAQLYKEYKDFFPKNEVNFFVSYYDYYQPESYLPITDTYIQKEASINEEIERLRHRATSNLMTRKDVIVVASVSCIYNLGLPTDYFKRAIYLEIGQILTRGDLIKQLVRIQYTRNNLSLKPGNFRVREESFEIIPPSEEVIYRIGLKDQKIISLEITHHLTRKIIKKLNKMIIFPAKHFVTEKTQAEDAIKNIKEELAERIKYFKDKKQYLEVERLNRVTKNDISMVQAVGYCHGIENYSRHLSGKLPGEPPETLLSYFPKTKNGKPDFLTIIDESHIAIPQIYGMYRGDRSRKENLIEYGWRLPSALDNRPLKQDEFLERVGQIICTSATPGKYESEKSSLIAEQIIRPTYLLDPKIEIQPVYNKKTGLSQIDHLEKEIKKIIQKNERVLINALTKKMAEELADYLNRKKIKAQFMHSDTVTLERAQILTDFRKGKFNCLVGVNLLREGLDLPEVSLVAILESDQEGFLRSETSFIQTMGRAARNLKGRVILYADKETTSMKRAIEEVERRREIQLSYNQKYNLKPKSIIKNIQPLIDLSQITKDEKLDENEIKDFYKI